MKPAYADSEQSAQISTVSWSLAQRCLPVASRFERVYLVLVRKRLWRDVCIKYSKIVGCKRGWIAGAQEISKLPRSHERFPKQGVELQQAQMLDPAGPCVWIKRLGSELQGLRIHSAGPMKQGAARLQRSLTVLSRQVNDVHSLSERPVSSLSIDATNGPQGLSGVWRLCSVSNARRAHPSCKQLLFKVHSVHKALNLILAERTSA